MDKTSRKEGGSRHGKHAPGAFRVSLYLSSEEKAVAVLAAELEGCTLSDILRSGITSEATRLGIMSNGSIGEPFRQRVDAYKKVLEAESKAVRSTNDD